MDPGTPPDAAARPRPLGRAEYRRWAEAQPRGRWERVDGEVIAMNAERAGHVRLKFRAWQLLDRSVLTSRIVASGLIVLDPPGMSLSVEALFEGLD